MLSRWNDAVSSKLTIEGIFFKNNICKSSEALSSFLRVEYIFFANMSVILTKRILVKTLFCLILNISEISSHGGILDETIACNNWMRFFELVCGVCLKALVNEDTLLRTHCCPWCSLGCVNWETFVADTKCFWTKSETFVSVTMCPQQCVLVCQDLYNVFSSLHQ